MSSEMICDKRYVKLKISNLNIIKSFSTMFKELGGAVDHDPSIRSEPRPSDPRIILLKPRPLPSGPELPIVTRVLQIPLLLLAQLDLCLVLENLERKPTRCVPRDMAVHEPRSGVVGLERQNQVPLRRQQRDIPTRWVVQRQVQTTDPVRLLRLLENGKVVPVQMDGVRCWREEAPRAWDAGTGNEEIDPCVSLLILCDDDKVLVPFRA